MRGGTPSSSSIIYLINIFPCARNHLPVPHRVKQVRGPRVWSVAFSPDGHHIISGSDDHTIRIWDAGTGSAVGKPLQGHTAWVRTVAYSPNGSRIISGSDDNMIRIWDAKTGFALGKPLEGHTRQVWSIAYSPNGQRIISGSSDKTIRMWDAETVSAVGEPFEGHTDWVSSVAYSPDGRLIISGSNDMTIRMWDAETGSAVGEPFEGHTCMVWSIAYSPVRRHIISGSTDCTVRMWNPETASLGPSCTDIQISSHFYALPDPEGWVRDPEGGLLYWVPLDSRKALHSPALLTLPRTSDVRSVSLDFNDFVFGTSWTNGLNTVPS